MPSNVQERGAASLEHVHAAGGIMFSIAAAGLECIAEMLYRLAMPRS
jgi:hypothetical protein